MTFLNRCFPIILAISVAGNLAAEPFMVDDFESKDLLSTNEAGFRWSGDASYGGNDGEATYLDSMVSRLSNAEGQGLHFRYPGGTKWTEKRFDLGAAYEEIWVSYWLKVPDNFYHRDRSPANNKLFAIWMDDYSAKGDGPTVIWEYWRSGEGSSNLAVHYSAGEHTTAGPHLQNRPFISYPDDQGRWMQVVLRVRAASSRGANDGLIETHRRWFGETEFTQLHELTNADIALPPGGPSGWNKGYFMGYANTAFSEETIWVIDEVKFSESSLLSGSSNANPPSAPANIQLQLE